MMDLTLLFQTVQACSPSALNVNNWIGINVLVVLAFLGVASFIYATSNLMSNTYRERVRKILRGEYTECMISIFLITSLITISYASCNIGASLSGLGSNYQNVFQADNYYIGTLLFSKGTGIVSGLITQGLFLSIDGLIANQVLSSYNAYINNQLPNEGTIAGTPNPQVGQPAYAIEAEYDGDIYTVYNSYADVYTTYAGFIVLGFGVLFVLFFMLPIISSTALVLLVPVAIIMRSLAFSGPKLREAANALLALSIALYFVFPLAISMNGYVVSWVYCTQSPYQLSVANAPSAPSTSCNPYPQYVSAYAINSIPISTFFAQNAISEYNSGALQSNFLGAANLGTGNIVNTVTTLVQGLVGLPSLISNYTNQVAEYLFECVVLVALDFAITMGFAQSLYKGLNSISGVLGAGSFW